MIEQLCAVHAFMKKMSMQMGRGVPCDPMPDAASQLAFLAKLDEEKAELSAAMLDGNIEKIADGLGDMLYLIIGGFLKYNLSPERVFNEIHKSNMTKELGLFNQVLKGESYRPPNMRYAIYGE